jgi:hypothetical protein
LSIAKTKSTDEVEKALYTGASKVLQYIVAKIDQEGIKWLNAHFAELPDTLAQRTFLKAVLHKALSDGIIGKEEAKLFIQCIVKKGITAIIDLKGNKIILEDSSYPLDASSKTNLMHIINGGIRFSQDKVAKQYREHNPLFVNRGSALPVATADIKYVGSVVDNVELDSKHWHLSVMHLSDHHKNRPQEVFLLLEQRSYVGEYIIKKIVLQERNVTVETKAINPNSLNTNLREELFGKMSYIDTKPRYYGLSFVLSEEVGQKLLFACANQASSLEIGDAYKVLHELAGSHVALLQNSNNQSSLLSLSWPKYVEHPEVVEYKKDQLLQVDAEQVRKDSRAIESQELVRVQSKQIGKHEDQLQETRIVVEDHDQQMEILKFGIKNQNEQLQETGMKVEDLDQKTENLKGEIKEQNKQLQETRVEVEDQSQRMGNLEFGIKEQNKQLQETRVDVEDQGQRINRPEKTLEISSIKEKGMVAQSATVKRTDLKLVADLFDTKTLQKVKEQASKGLWKKTMQRPGKEKECEEYFEEKYLTECLKAAHLKNAKVAVNKETILAARIVLFKTMSEAILWSKKPLEAFKCADEFGKAYPELTKQIAREYPEYFLDIAIAEHCIKDNKNLLDEVKTKLPAKSRW